MTAEEQLAEVIGGRGILIRWKTVATFVGLTLTGLATLAGWAVSWVSQRHGELVSRVSSLQTSVAVLQHDVADIRDRLSARQQAAR